MHGVKKRHIKMHFAIDVKTKEAVAMEVATYTTSQANPSIGRLRRGWYVMKPASRRSRHTPAALRPIRPKASKAVKIMGKGLKRVSPSKQE